MPSSVSSKVSKRFASLGDLMQETNNQEHTPDEIIEYSRPASDIMLRRANILIESRYRASMMETKVMTLGLYKLQNQSSHSLTVSFSKAELARVMGVENQTWIYEQLRRVSKRIVQHFHHIENPQEREFQSFAIVTNAEFKQGTFSLTFNGKVMPYLVDRGLKYTPMQLRILMSFDMTKNNFAFRLYEILRIRRYKLDKAPYPKYITVPYRVSELKIMIGVVNTDDPAIQDAIDRGLDYDYIVEKIAVNGETKMYDKWYDFRRYVLEPAMKEINEKTDIHVDYKLEKGNKGGKVQSIVFILSKNEAFVEENEKQEPKELTVEQLIVMEEFIEEPLSTSAKASLFKAANGDLERIRQAYYLAKQQPEVRNLVGFMISALKGNYEGEEAIPSMRGASYEEAKAFSELTKASNEDFLIFQKSGVLPSYMQSGQEVTEVYPEDDIIDRIASSGKKAKEKGRRGARKKKDL